MPRIIKKGINPGCWCARAAITRYHRLAGLNNKDLLSHSPEAEISGSRCQLSCLLLGL